MKKFWIAVLFCGGFSVRHHPYTNRRGRVIIEIPYHFVIQSVAKDLVNTYFMYSRFFASL